MTTKRPSLFSDIPGKWRGRTLRRGCESNILTFIITIPYIVVVVLRLTHRYLVKAVRGHNTGSNTLEWKITSGGKKHTHKIYTSYAYTCFFPIQCESSPFFSLPPSGNSDPGSHNRLFPTATVGALLFHRENISAISSLVDSRRIVP